LLVLVAAGWNPRDALTSRGFTQEAAPASSKQRRFTRSPPAGGASVRTAECRPAAPPRTPSPLAVRAIGLHLHARLVQLQPHEYGR